MAIVFQSDSSYDNDKVAAAIAQFAVDGELLFGGQRNAIKLFNIDGREVVVKSFKIPNLINKIAYKYFRKSKARRSFEYANRLLDLGIGTPQPIAYSENFDWLGILDSYYVSEHLPTPLTFRDLVENPDYPDHDNILIQFTKFTFDLHEKNIEFLDHSPGNTLIRNCGDGQYEFYLVDLNRMHFNTEMTFDKRMKNMSRLTPKIEMVKVMSQEYARLAHLPAKHVFEVLWTYTEAFQYKYYRKKRIKKKLMFWK